MNTSTPGFAIQHIGNEGEWLAAWAAGLAPSEMLTLAGDGRHGDTPVKLWRRKVGEVPARPQGESELKKVIPLLFSSRAGAELQPFRDNRYIAIMDGKPWLRVSPDALYWPKDADASSRTPGAARLLLCFITSHKIKDHHALPLRWRLSAYYNMRVFGKDSATVAWMSSEGGISFGYADVAFDSGEWSRVEDAIDDFWTGNVLNGRCPDVVVTNEDAMRVWDKAVDGKRVVADDDVHRDLRRLLELKANEKAMKEEVAELQLRLRRFFGDAEELVDKGGAMLATWKNVASGSSFQQEAFRRDHPELYEMYMKPDAPSRRLVMKGQYSQPVA